MDRHEAWDWLVTNEALVRKAIRYALIQRNYGIGVDDLVSVVMARAVDGLMRFDPERGMSLVSYAFGACRYATLEELREKRWHDGRERRGLGVRLDVTPTDPHSPLWEYVGCEADDGSGFADLISGLTPREQTILRAIYLDGITLVRIGQALGVTESRVSQIRTRAERKIRAQLEAA